MNERAKSLGEEICRDIKRARYECKTWEDCERATISRLSGEPEFNAPAPQPPVSKERIEAALLKHGLLPSRDLIERLAAELAQPEPWVKCSERMPVKGQPVWYALPGWKEPFASIDGHILARDYYWKPRHIPTSPAPPVEEDSEQIKELRDIQSRSGRDVAAGIERAIGIIKKFEQKGVRP